MSQSRRDFLKMLSVALCFPHANVNGKTPPVDSIVNDVHSQLNATRVFSIVRPTHIDDLRECIWAASRLEKSISICGKRHSMGGQQFGTDSVLVDITGFDRVLGFDQEQGIVEVESGITWPQLIDFLLQAQHGQAQQWGIIQKQTGADELTLGGALASNVHGRGLAMKPIIDNVESFELLDATGQLLSCSRAQNTELFKLVIGGYGLFGIVTSIRLRLWPRKKVKRVVKIGETQTIISAFEDRIQNEFLYGDYQFATDFKRESFLRRGVFSCYQLMPPDTPVTPNPTRFHPQDWAKLTYYSHKYKRRAFQVYTKRYLATSGQIYWSDSQLSAAYVENYHADLDRKLGAKVKATEMITEIYVPRVSLAEYMEAARSELIRLKANVIYGTVRLIEKDEESFLAWAKENYACIIFNLHISHTPEKIEGAATVFKRLIDLALPYGGSYYLTYHRFATKEQVAACYPQFEEFLRLKLKYDPKEVFQSDWYRHHKQLFR
ncbi:MAG: FAD-binding oxidoreductase [Acidobacteria bacterium]|nr:FAD-binding oxidoreductase [Acidobacteriota bacterium]